jgi:hypothetical protein
MKDALKFFSGSIAVYVIMAACAGGSSGSRSNGSGGVAQDGAPGAGGSAQGGALGGGGSPASDLDASTGEDSSVVADAADGSDGSVSPVPDANAQTDASQPGTGGGSGNSGPQVDTVECDVVIDGVVYAEKAYPGRSVIDLASLRCIGVLSELTAFGTVTHQQENAFLEDGVARVGCGTPSARLYTSVMFVLP